MNRRAPGRHATGVERAPVSAAEQAPASAAERAPASAAQRAPAVPSAGVDRLKGLLLLAVIFGHTYSQTVSHSLTKALIYGWHMPAFLFVSGYLIDFVRLRRRSPAAFLGHYWRRMLWQWAAVSVVWAVSPLGDVDLRHDDLVRTFLRYPLFHLWFVPALMLMLTVSYACSRWLGRAGPAALVVLAVLAAALWLHDMIVRQDVGFDARYVGYPIWFVLGVAARNAWFRCPLPIAAVLAGAGSVLYLETFRLDVPDDVGRSWVGFLVLNLGLTAFVPAACRTLQHAPDRRDALRVLGEHSLWVYLLHPFAAQEFARHVDVVWQQRVGGVVLTIAVVAVAVVVVRLRQLVPLGLRGLRPGSTG